MKPNRTTARRRRWTVVSLLLTLVLTSCKQWGPVESSYNGSVRVSAKGTAYLESGQRVVNSLTLTDRKDDGNTVYATTKAYSLRQVTGCSTPPCGTDWWPLGSKTTQEISNETRSFKHTFPLDPIGLQIRLRVQACAQMGWPVPDSCSNEPAIATFSY